MISKNMPTPVAVIDVGSNSVRLDIRESAAVDAPIIIQRKSLSRLGKGITKKGELSQTRMDYTLKTLKKFSDLMKKNQVGAYKAVATAAIRSAANGADFIKTIKEKTGLTVDIISGEEEARLTALGVMSAAQAPPTGLVADLGGGSLELIRLDKGRIGHVASLPLGVHKIESLDQKGATQITNELKKYKWLKRKTLKLYAVGGTWRACARLHLAGLELPHRKVDRHRIAGSKVTPFCNWILNETYLRTPARDAIEKHRMEEIPIAALILKVLSKYVDHPEVVISQSGIREGCFADMRG